MDRNKRRYVGCLLVKFCFRHALRHWVIVTKFIQPCLNGLTECCHPRLLLGRAVCRVLFLRFLDHGVPNKDGVDCGIDSLPHPPHKRGPLTSRLPNETDQQLPCAFFRIYPIEVPPSFGYLVPFEEVPVRNECKVI